jgi:hypothetical protein
VILKFFKSILMKEQEHEIHELKSRVKECEETIEKLVKSVDILIKFGEETSVDLNTVASHVLLMKMSMGDIHLAEHVLRKKNPDDDLIN